MSPKKLFAVLLVLISTVTSTSLGAVHGELSTQNSNTTRCLDREREALLKFKAELVDEFGLLSSWGNGEEKPDCCNWRGVHCDNETYHIVRLDLHSTGEAFYSRETLKGTISTSLIELQHLQYLDLSANHFDVSIHEFIPDGFENMLSLEHLSLMGTGLQGVIPKCFGNMSSLRYLDLSYNNLTQASECCLQLPYLEFLDFSFNKIKGPVPNLSGCPSLKELRLDNNMFNGTLTDTIGGLSKLEILSIRWNLLEGMISEAHMFNLSQLQYLDLSFNSRLTIKFNPDWIPSFQLEHIALARCNLGPNFPVWLQTQKKMMHIDISDAGITDIIPTWFGRVAAHLVHFNASYNQIRGVIPEFSFTNKHFVDMTIMISDLSSNKISGPINFLCQIHGWWFLDLSENQLSGQIPLCFKFFERLGYLNLANNHFVGEIPNVFGRELSLLNLRNNKFTGELPTSLGNCTHLTIIDLGENSLKGEIPAWIGVKHPELAVLVLRSNEFYGSIPASLCNLVNVQIMDLSANNISGVIPRCVSKWIAMTGKAGTSSIGYNPYYSNAQVGLGPALDSNSIESAYFMWKRKEVKYINHLGLVKLLDLSANSLHGETPSEITELDGLIGLNLSTNNLIGFIPPNIGEMKSINFLDLSRNILSGSIPPGISGLSYLGPLDLSYNNLSGRIPQVNQALTFEESAYVGNPGLCALPVNKPCPGDQKPQNPSSSVDHSGQTMEDSNDDELVTDGFYIAVAIGFVCSFSGVFWTTVLNKSIGDALFSKVFR